MNQATERLISAINFRALWMFCRAAEHGNCGNGARAIGVHPESLASNVRNTEAMLGLRLFETPRGSTRELSSAGRALWHGMAPIFGAMEHPQFANSLWIFCLFAKHGQKAPEIAGIDRNAIRYHVRKLEAVIGSLIDKGITNAGRELARESAPLFAKVPGVIAGASKAAQG